MAAIPTILKGDDSGAIQITLATGRSYIGATLVVAYQGVTRSYTGLNPGQTINLTFTHEETAGFALGTKPLLMRLVGQYGCEETVENADARVKVTDCLAEVNAGGSFIVRPGQAGTDPTKVPITDVGDVAARFTMADLQAKVNQIIRVLAQRSLLAVAVALLGGAAFGDIAIHSARLDSLYNDAMVVTNVTGAATDPSVVSNIVESYGYETASHASLTYQTKISDYTTTNAVTNIVANAITNKIDAIGTNNVSRSFVLRDNNINVLEFTDTEIFGGWWYFNGLAEAANQVPWSGVFDEPDFVLSNNFTTATNVLASAITNKADKSELAGYLPLTGGTMSNAVAFSSELLGNKIIIETRPATYSQGVIKLSDESHPTISGFTIDGGENSHGYDDFTWITAKGPGSTSLQEALNSKASAPWTSALLKGNGSGGIVAATAGTDYLDEETADGRYLQKTGGTMTGELKLTSAYGTTRLTFEETDVVSSWYLDKYGFGFGTSSDKVIVPGFGRKGIAYKVQTLATSVSANGTKCETTFNTGDVDISNIANGILTTAENTAGTKIDRGYTPTNAVVKLSRSVQYVADPAGVTIQVPTVIPQGIRDWVVYVQNTGAATIPLTLDSSVSWYGADAAYTNALKNGKMTALYFTEITTNKFAIGRAELDAIQSAH